MTAGDLVELQNEERWRFCAFLGAKPKKCTNFRIGLWLSWFSLKLIELPGDKGEEMGRVLRVGGELSPPWVPGFLGHGADVTTRADVEHQDRPGCWLAS